MKKTLSAVFLGAMLGVAAGLPADAENLAPSPAWARAMPPGPDARVKVTEPYARMVAREAYFWAWPMINIYNKRLGFGSAPEPGLLDGILPFAPVNRLAMLTDYIDPAERAVACPNQDVAYGGGPLALDVSPVVVQVPDFGDRFWVYQIVDLRTDSFASLGKMYGTTPGFYLLIGPNWRGSPSRRGSHRSFAQRPIRASSRRAYSSMTRRRTSRRLKRRLAASTCIRSPSSTER